MRAFYRCLLAVIVCGVAFLKPVAQCPARPQPGSIIVDPLAISSQNGVLSAELTMQHSVDDGGYNHYCYNYRTPTGNVEAPTLRLNQGDTLKLKVLDRIQDVDAGMKMALPPGKVCRDGGQMTFYEPI